MNLGPLTHGTDSGGRYDAEVTQAREATQAALCMLIVIGGNRGTGFSVQCIDEALVQAIPTLLRNVADRIEKEQRS
jgi:hypothetical protein